MIPQKETEKILEQRLMLLSAVEVFAVNGLNKTTTSMLVEKLQITEEEFRKIFRDKTTLLEEVCDYYGPNTSGSNLITNDLMDDLTSPYNFLRSFVLKLVKKWDSKGDRFYLKLLLNNQPIVFEQNILTLSYYMNDARSLWWMIFEEMINHQFIEPIDPVILANEFITPLFMNRIENLLPVSNSDFTYVQDMALSHLGFFWDNVKNPDMFYE
ncbi:MAG: hypothetical protein SCALA702_16340 [Melioribacteraceae bacterium]|nr:MAG: hypothetical protein SCALA702_16340 [Melioribacteraceae bacterium]